MELPESTLRLRELWRYMSTRAFVAGRAELMAQGFGPSQIQSWLRSGRLVPAVHGVYSYGRDIESADAAWRASLIAAGPGSALTGVSACEKWRLVRPWHGLPKSIEVAVESGQARVLRGLSPAMRGTEIKISRREREPGDVRRVDGIALLKAGMTLIDFAENGSDREVRFAFLEACRLGLFREQDVPYCFRRMVGRRGARTLRPMFSLWVPELNRIKSVFEGLWLLVWIERQYPMPLVNEKVFGKEIDNYWPDEKFALELDGGAFHSDPVQRRIDYEKQRYLESRGIAVVRLSYRQIDANPYGEVDRVAGMLGFI